MLGRCSASIENARLLADGSRILISASPFRKMAQYQPKEGFCKDSLRFFLAKNQLCLQIRRFTMAHKRRRLDAHRIEVLRAGFGTDEMGKRQGSSMMRNSVYLTTMVLLLGAGSVQGSIFVSAGQPDAKEVDRLHTQWWAFTPGQDTDISGGLFSMKRGPKTVEDITLDIIEGGFQDPYADGYSDITPLLSVTLSPGRFTQSFGSIVFEAPEPITLSAGTTYTAILYSLAGTQGSRQYFLRGISGSGNSILLVDANGNPVSADVPSQAHMPEPSTLLVWSLLGGVAGVAGWRRRRLSK